jgi:predicted thioredoxin/glutaredoxin
MYIITNTNCQNCKTLERMLGEEVNKVPYVIASENMDLCRKLNIRQVPALVKDDNSVEFDLQEIVKVVKNDKRNN